VITPPSYNCKSPVPLVVVLHDYASSGAAADAYLGIGAEADAQGFLYVLPDGTKDARGNAFWNATDACGGAGVDDSSYLSNMIWNVRAQYNVDPKRVYLVGYGNGGFMAHRMACDHPDQITAIASLGGAMWDDVSKCTPDGPVSVVEIHGTADADFAYGGGTHMGQPFPSAPTTFADWVTINRCKGAADMSAPPMDLDTSVPGAETTVERYPECVLGVSVQLWTMQGSTHTPALSSTFASTVLGFLLAHPKA
jgi:polyhydroxybutyrate depolymerase